MTRGSYSTALVEVFMNDILAENTYFTNHLGWTGHKIMVLKPTNKYKIIQQWHNFESILNNFLHHQTLYCKGFLNIIFYGAENKKNG